MAGTDLCEHVRVGRWPFQAELVLDEHLGITDALMRCRDCGRFYLLEMLDWRDRHRVMRVAPMDDAAAERLIRDLTRGSCDVNRAGAEVQYVRTATPFTRVLLLIDTTGPRIEAVGEPPGDRRIPGASWRELPCDGSWVDVLSDAAPPP
ncbi:MAG TPA: hypothetical protein VF210_16525 [Pseudomonadales bacterium]